MHILEQHCGYVIDKAGEMCNFSAWRVSLWVCIYSNQHISQWYGTVEHSKRSSLQKYIKILWLLPIFNGVLLLIYLICLILPIVRLHYYLKMQFLCKLTNLRSTPNQCRRSEEVYVRLTDRGTLFSDLSKSRISIFS